MTFDLYHGDCLDVMAGLPDASVDCVVTDPPYGLGFPYHSYQDTRDSLRRLIESVRHVGAKGYKAQKIAPVQRQIGDALLLDDRADRSVFGGEQGHCPADLDGFTDLTNLEREIDAPVTMFRPFGSAGSTLRVLIVAGMIPS